MEAEVIRDHLLSVSGALHTKMYGPSTSIGSREEPFKDNAGHLAPVGLPHVAALHPPSGPQDLRPSGQHAKRRPS